MRVTGRVPAAMAARYSRFAVDQPGGMSPAGQAARPGAHGSPPAPTPATPGSISTRSRRRRSRPASALGAHRDRGRDPSRSGRAGAAALRPGRPARDRAGQRARPDRRRVPRRAAGAAAEHRSRRARSRSPPGDRIAQLVLVRVEAPEVVEVDALAVSERGAGGFGSSGAEPAAAQWRGRGTSPWAGRNCLATTFGSSPGDIDRGVELADHRQRQQCADAVDGGRERRPFGEQDLGSGPRGRRCPSRTRARGRAAARSCPVTS